MLNFIYKGPAARDEPSILYVIGSTGLGGAEQHLLNVSGRLSEQGFRCSVFALDPAGPLESAFERAGISVLGVRLPNWLARILPSAQLRARVRIALAAPYLLWLYWWRRPDIVHFFLPAAYIIGAITSLLGPKMFRIMSRRSLNHYQAKYRLFRRIEHLLHARIDFVCGNSKAVIADLLAEGVRHEQIRLIYNGIVMERFHCAQKRLVVRNELLIADDALVFVIVANLIPYKGHADLIEAFGQINDRLPDQWICLCVGRDDGIGDALRAQAGALGISDRMRFLGSRQDVPDLLAAADIGVLCSHEEGFSNAVLEGMAAALPMVVTDVGGNAEAVLHGTTGLVVAPHAPDQLAEALLSMALSPERTQMGEAGRHRVKTLFSMDACVQAYADLYRS